MTMWKLINEDLGLYRFTVRGRFMLPYHWARHDMGPDILCQGDLTHRVTLQQANNPGQTYLSYALDCDPGQERNPTNLYSVATFIQGPLDANMLSLERNLIIWLDASELRQRPPMSSPILPHTWERTQGAYYTLIQLPGVMGGMLWHDITVTDYDTFITVDYSVHATPHDRDEDTSNFLLVSSHKVKSQGVITIQDTINSIERGLITKRNGVF